MAAPLFIHTLFVSYSKSVPSAQRIPYTTGAALTGEVLSRLARQIPDGWITMVQMEDETSENSLVADFRDGWATVYVVREVEHYFELLNSEDPDGDELLNITGDGPTPKRHATRDLSLMADIIAYFARTGRPFPGCRWEESVH